MERENEAWLDLRSVLYGFNKNQKEGKQMSVWLDSIFEKRPTHTHTDYSIANERVLCVSHLIYRPDTAPAMACIV